jgi:glycerol uptake facilitator-like aquaporin
VPVTPTSRGRLLAGEALGTMFLLVAVVGSGIMGERLAAGNAALALLANSLATGAALVALILALRHDCGAHFNPLVTLASAGQRRTPWRDVAPIAAAQVGGAFAGVVAAHLMFALPPLQAATHERAGVAQAFSEVVATFGLLTIVTGGSRGRVAPGADATPFAVGAWIAGAYWFTASTSFANPAVTLARTLTDTFTGIRPVDAPPFLLAQLLGAAAAVLVWRWFGPPRR